MKIYIAGPYTKGDVAVNVRNAVYAGNFLANRGHIVFIPHLTHFWHMLIPNTYDFWMAQDEAWLRECDAVLRIEGESAGADKEVEIAASLGLPIYKNVFEVP
jgi:nucleoside 2-deoxyribosyltransferase